MKTKLFDYVDRDNVIYNLSGLTKLICFLCLTFSVMLSYDIRYILFVFIVCIVIFKVSELSFKRVKGMFLYVGIFLFMNTILSYLFEPTYGVDIYGTSHEIFRFNSYFIVTQEQLLYQITKLMKYLSVVPLGMIFLFTTNPSELAASLNRAGISYRVSYTLSLTLRYFPDMIRSYQEISVAQQSRGLDMSKKEKLGTRIKNILNICVPLIFSTLDRIELISNAMDLRGFGKNRKRTWYVAKPLKKNDYIAIAVGGAIFVGSVLLSVLVNGSRFWNPFI